MRAVLVLAVLLSGCAAPALLQAEDEAFAAVVSVIDPAGGHGEPSFGAAPDGTLYANGRGGRGGGVYRSTDGGASWARVATPLEPLLNGDPDLAVDRDGTVWFAGLWLGCSAVAVSRDGGASWSVNPLACGAPLVDRPYVIPTRGGTAYHYAHQLGTFWQMAAKTTDHGRTWVPLGAAEGVDHLYLVNGGSGWGGGGFWNEARGSVFFTFGWHDATTDPEALVEGFPQAPAFAVTRDGGRSFQRGILPRAHFTGILVTGAADDAGNAYLAWAAMRGGESGVWLARSADDGASWSEAVRVDAGPGADAMPVVAAGAAGRVAVAYYEADAPGAPGEVPRDASWRVTLAWTGDALADAPAFRHGDLSGAVVRRGPMCLEGSLCERDREFADYFQAKRLPDGRVGAVFNSLEAVPGRLVEVFAATRAPLLADIAPPS